LDLENHRFDWDNILPNYLNGYTAAQADAVADLVYACGATTRMDYNLDGSGTNTDYVADALVSFFDYSPEVDKLARADYTDAKWLEILQTELKAGRPILMRSMQPSGAGHAYVMDGYYVQKGYEKYPYFHFNWGWEGKEDGWFLLNNLQAGGYDLRSNQEIIRYIMPLNGTANEIVEADGVDTAIYDLLGRRVATPVKGHIYLQGGKKFMAQ
ncbi:MAG: C10 family peptidase, partial [Paludibacteraceae bacterium]